MLHLHSMGDHFQWQFDQSPPEQPSRIGRHSARGGAAVFWTIALSLTILIVAAWFVVRHQLHEADQTRAAAAQALLDLAARAIKEGDGELFYSLHSPEPDWFAAQLQPRNLRFYRARPTITNIQQSGEMLHASAAWQENDQLYQRVLFLSQLAGQLRQQAGDPAYWGKQQTREFAWGELRFWSIDESWSEPIAAFVGAEIARLCAADCLAERLPLHLEIRASYSETAEPGHLVLPSPRLLGLDNAGQPSDLFYEPLTQQLHDYLTPARIRFAIPDEMFPRIDYQEAAELFTAANPHIKVELVPLSSPPASAQDLARLDGAAFAPTIEMITAGRVQDLTDYVRTDPDFAPQDFYDQIWQGAVWRERVWFIPQAAHMRLVFYHRDAYRHRRLPEPIIGWTWTEMNEEVVRLVGAKIETGAELDWGYLDQTVDTLYSFAFYSQSACPTSESRPCLLPLTGKDIASALRWYLRMAGEAEVLPDPSQLPQPVREGLLINSLFKTAVWVDEPVFYEHRTMMFPMGVVPFPGSDRFESSTPLWVQGSFVTSASQRPLAVWQWLKFLSYWPPRPTYRLIPARPSVGQQVKYWTGLPRALAEPMRAAFPLARPVRLQDRQVFNWLMLREVMNGRQNPEEAALRAREHTWFGGDAR